MRCEAVGRVSRVLAVGVATWLWAGTGAVGQVSVSVGTSSSSVSLGGGSVSATSSTVFAVEGRRLIIRDVRTGGFSGGFRLGNRTVRRGLDGSLILVPRDSDRVIYGAYLGQPVITPDYASARGDTTGLVGVGVAEPVRFEDLPATERAEAYLGFDLVEQALVVLGDRVAEAPADAAARRLLGVAQLRAGRWEEGAASLATAYAQSPEMAASALPRDLFEDRRELRRLVLVAMRRSRGEVSGTQGASWVTLLALLQAEGRVALALKQVARARERAPEGAAGGLPVGVTSAWEAALTAEPVAGAELLPASDGHGASGGGVDDQGATDGGDRGETGSPGAVEPGA